MFKDSLLHTHNFCPTDTSIINNVDSRINRFLGQLLEKAVCNSSISRKKKPAKIAQDPKTAYGRVLAATRLLTVSLINE